MKKNHFFLLPICLLLLSLILFACNPYKGYEEISKSEGYVILRNKKINSAGEKLFDGEYPVHDLLRGTEPILSKDAAPFIKEYLRLHEKDADSLYFIDLDFSKVIAYLDTVSRTLGGFADLDRIGIRIYPAIRTSDEVDRAQIGKKTIILVPTLDGIDTYDDSKVSPIDYGNLCPPHCPDTSAKKSLFRMARLLN